MYLSVYLAMLLFPARHAVAAESPAPARPSLTFVTDEAGLCPYTNCTDGRAGYVLELARLVFERAGYQVDIDTLPPGRALLLVRSGKADGLVNTIQPQAPELLYPATPVARFEGALFLRNDLDWAFDGAESLSALRLGLVQSAAYSSRGGEISRYIVSNAQHPSRVTWISGEDPHKTIFRMIGQGRLDATLDDHLAGQYQRHQAGLTSQIRVARVFPGAVYGYIGFPPDSALSGELAGVFDRGMAELLRTGELQALLASYGIQGPVQLRPVPES